MKRVRYTNIFSQTYLAQKRLETNQIRIATGTLSLSLLVITFKELEWLKYLGKYDALDSQNSDRW